MRQSNNETVKLRDTEAMRQSNYKTVKQ